MSVKLPKRLSSKKKKYPASSAQAELLHSLGLDPVGTSPLDPASMLNISTWALESEAPQKIKDLPNAFLQRLWLLSAHARSSSCVAERGDPGDAAGSPEKLSDGAAANPLDLVTAVFMSANTFLQQEMMARMLKCRFAAPLVIPCFDPDEPGRFLLWPQRGAVGRWRPSFPGQSEKICEGNLASTSMPMVSCVRLGHCGVSKSQVLNGVIGSTGDTFLHRGVEGGELPRRLSNGLIEISWCLPTGDPAADPFPIPVVVSNLRGDAGSHEKCLDLLCRASSAIVVFCGDLREKETQLLASCKDKTSNLIIVELSGETHTGGFDQVIKRGDLGEEELAVRLRQTLTELLPDKVKAVTLEAVAQLAKELAFQVDEAAVCQKAMATAQEVLKGLEGGADQYKDEQLPLQGRLWSKLAEIERKERKPTKEGSETGPQSNEKVEVLAGLNGHKMTPAMKIFTHALFAADKTERTFFLHWMRLRLEQMQSGEQAAPRPPVINAAAETNGGPSENHHIENGGDFEAEDSDSFCTDSTIEEEEMAEVPTGPAAINHADESTRGTAGDEWSSPEEEDSSCDPCLVEELHLTSNGTESRSEGGDDDGEGSGEQRSGPRETESLSSGRRRGVHSNPSVRQVSRPQLWTPTTRPLTLEHFLCEMGLMFELACLSPGGRSREVSRLPGVAAELLLYGVPLQLMDGDASTVPVRWLGCVFEELRRRLPQESRRIRVLTNLGPHHAHNAAVASALFAVTFPGGRSTKGIYMLILSVPNDLREDLGCDFLLLIDVEGLSSDGSDAASDRDLATVAAGLSDVLLLNISSQASDELESHLALVVSALLRVQEGGSVPVCQLLLQDERIHSVLQASQLKHVSDVLQSKTLDQSPGLPSNRRAGAGTCVTVVNGPWNDTSLSEEVDPHYSRDVLKLKRNLFGALRMRMATTEAAGLPEFMGRLGAIWDAVRAESFPTGPRGSELALAFTSLCTEFSQWQDGFLEHVEQWLDRTRENIFAVKANSVIHSGLVDEAEEEVKAEAENLQAKVEAYFANHDLLKTTALKAVMLGTVESLQERVTRDLKDRLVAVNENHCSSTQLQTFETVLEKEKQLKLRAMIESSKSEPVLLQDSQLEEEFEGVWSHILSNFNFRPSEADDITTRVRNVLRENLISRGLYKHLKKLDDVGRSQTADEQNQKFYIYDEHFGYRSRLKHMFESNNRLQKLEAQHLACSIIQQYGQFVEEKSSSPGEFSDGYIKDLLGNVERGLKDKSIVVKSAFEVDLKIFLCNAACQDFQKLHDRYAKDRELLQHISANKSVYQAQFMYQFRKMDQCHRMARAFTAMVLRPTVVDYVHRNLVMRITDEVRGQTQRYRSQHAFHQSLLEELIGEDAFESFLDYLHSFDAFRLRRLQETVADHLSQSDSLMTWRQQRLGEIVGMMAAAVSEAAEGTAGVLSEAKPLLERVCLTLERDGDVEVARAALDGPLFSITVKWDHFVTCLLELLAAMRLELAREFTENADVEQFLRNLPVQPHEYLLKGVKGCEERCPLCRTPCEVEEAGHRVHGATLHRPTAMLPNKPPPLSDISSLEIKDTGERKDTDDSEDTDDRKDTDGSSLICGDLHSPDWTPCTNGPSSQIPSAYWRYVLARFNDRFAEEYQQEPARIPEEWKKITENEALDSLKEAFATP